MFFGQIYITMLHYLNLELLDKCYWILTFYKVNKHNCFMDYVKICYCTKITPYPHCEIKSAGHDDLLNS